MAREDSNSARRRSTRTSRPPTRLDASSGNGNASTPTTPRKRSKSTLKMGAATPATANKRRRTAQLKSGNIDDEPVPDSGDSQNEDDAAEDDDSDIEVSNSGESSGDDDEESDFEETTAVKKTRVARKSIAHVAKSPARKISKKNTKAKSARIENSNSDTEEASPSQLLNAILDSKVALAQVAIDWIDSYRESPDSAACELINFILKLSGCPGAITEELLDDSEEISNILESLQNQSISALKRGGSGVGSMEIDNGDDLLMGKTKEQRKFRRNTLTFLTKIFEEGQHYLIFSDVGDENGLSQFAEILLQWLVNMASSSYRPFRHTATVVSLVLQSVLVSIRARLSVEQQTAHRQLEAETKRLAGNASGRTAKKASAKVDQLRARVETLTEQDEYAETAFKALYDTVFIYRYRDVHSVIRSECLVPLATWCRIYPASYLDTEFLRYLGWALNDKDPRVREAALVAISGPLLTSKPCSITQGNVGSGVGIIGSVDNVTEDTIMEGVRPFVIRFLPRLVQVAVGDVDNKVQVAALKLISLLGKLDYLDPSSKVGNIRRIKGDSKGDKRASGAGGANARRGASKRKAKKSKSSFGTSLSQQMLEESSSEDEDEGEDANDDSQDMDIDSSQHMASDSNILNIQEFYSGDEHMSDGDDNNSISCPHHNVMRYIAPLVAHSHASIRVAASEIVAWWIKKDWSMATRAMVLGTGFNFERGGLELDEESNEGDSEAQSPQNGNSNGVDEDIEMNEDISIEHILESPEKKQQARKWILFKALGAFLWRLAYLESSEPTSNNADSDALDSRDVEQRQNWILEQAASRLEDVWASSPTSIGNAPNDESISMIPTLPSNESSASELDLEIDKTMSSEATLPLRLVAAAQVLWHRIPELSDLRTLTSFLTWDHTTLSNEQQKENSALSRFALSPAEETALVQSYAIWILERNKSISDKARRTRNKNDRTELEEELMLPTKLWQTTMVPLLVRNLDNPVRLLPIMHLVADVLDPQLIFDSNKTEVLAEIAIKVTQILDRYGGNVRLARLACWFLGKIDKTRILQAFSDPASAATTSAAEAEPTAPGALVIKAACTAAQSLSTATSAVPEMTHAHTAAYSDVYARLVCLRSLIRMADISACFASDVLTSEESWDVLEEKADTNMRPSSAAIESLYALVSTAVKCISTPTVPEKVAIAALDVAYHFLLWRTLNFETLIGAHTRHVVASDAEMDQSPYWKRVNSATKKLATDRDRLISLCIDLSNESHSPIYRRLRESAFVTLGSIYKLFTSNLVHPSGRPTDSISTQKAIELCRSLKAQSGPSLKRQIMEYYNSKLGEWAYIVAALTPDSDTPDSADSNTRLVLELCKQSASSLSVLYGRFCTLSAHLSQWVGDQIVPAKQIIPLASYIGMLGLESLEKKRKQAEKAGEQPRHQAKRKVGFVTLSAFDHIVQAAIDALKPCLVLQSTRSQTVKVYLQAMQASFAKYTSPDPSRDPPSDSVNVATLSRFIASALKTAASYSPANPMSPGRAQRGVNDGSGFVIAPAVVGASWAKAHVEAINYGFEQVIPQAVVKQAAQAASTNILDDNDEDMADDNAIIEREAVDPEQWAELVAPWFTALTQTITGILRPRHAEVINEHLSRLRTKLGILSDSSSADDSEAAATALTQYQRALDKELAKLDAIKARMEAVQQTVGSPIFTDIGSPGSIAATPYPLSSPPPMSPTPAPRSRFANAVNSPKSYNSPKP